MKPIKNPFSINLKTPTKKDDNVRENTNPFTQNIQFTDNDCVEIDFKHSYQIHNEYEADPLDLTDQQRKELFEEPVMQTENVLKAVIGYVPTDERRYCRYYNPISNACFKGSKCLLLHAPSIDGKYQRDYHLLFIIIFKCLFRRIYP